jgi:hypothetical protein
MRFSGYNFSQGMSMDKNHAVYFITVLALAANLVVAGVTAVVPPGAQDFNVSSTQPMSFAGPAPAHESPVPEGGFSVPLPVWTTAGLVLIGAALAALVILRRQKTYVPRTKRLQK